MNNNWHIKISDCSEAQKEVLKRVYGDLPININTYLGLHNGIVIGVFGPDGMGELITPEQAFERLGLDECSTGYKQSFFTSQEHVSDLARDLGIAEQKIKKLEQQLAAKPELQGIDWSKIKSKRADAIAQNVIDGEVALVVLKGEKVTNWCRFDSCEWNPAYESHWSIVATRPKPKYTQEQMQAVKAYDEWLDLNSGNFEPEECFDEWLKEVGND